MPFLTSRSTPPRGFKTSVSPEQSTYMKLPMSILTFLIRQRPRSRQADESDAGFKKRKLRHLAHLSNLSFIKRTRPTDNAAFHRPRAFGEDCNEFDDADSFIGWKRKRTASPTQEYFDDTDLPQPPTFKLRLTPATSSTPLQEVALSQPKQIVGYPFQSEVYNQQSFYVSLSLLTICRLSHVSLSTTTRMLRWLT